MIALIPALLLLFTLSLPAAAGQDADVRAAQGGGAGLHFESVFDGYQPYAHQPPAPWRQSVDRVGEVGGWRAYAREAAEPEDAGQQDARHGAPHSGHDHGGAP